MTGSGTQSDPYLVSTLADLNAIRNDGGKVYKFINDIDASATSSWNSGKGFNPISYFWGTIDGDGYVIKNLYMDRTGKQYGGLFENIAGSVSKLGVEYSYFKGGYIRSGLFAATISSSAIVQQCYAKGTLNIGYSAGAQCYNGGFVGEINCNTSHGVNNCFVWCNQTGSGYTSNYNGGFVGGATAGRIFSCYANGSNGGISSLTATGINRGFVGTKGSSFLISDCYYYSSRSDSYATNRQLYHNIGNLSSTYWSYDSTNEKNSGYAYIKEFFKSRGKIESRILASWIGNVLSSVITAGIKSKIEERILDSFVSAIQSGAIRSVNLQKLLDSKVSSITAEILTTRTLSRLVESAVKQITSEVLALGGATHIIDVESFIDRIVMGLLDNPTLKYEINLRTDIDRIVQGFMILDENKEIRTVNSYVKGIKLTSNIDYTSLNFKLDLKSVVERLNSSVEAVGSVKTYRIIVAHVNDITSDIIANYPIRVTRTIKSIARQIKGNVLCSISRNVILNSSIGQVSSKMQAKLFTINDRVVDAYIERFDVTTLRDADKNVALSAIVEAITSNADILDRNYRYNNAYMRSLMSELTTKRSDVSPEISVIERKPTITTLDRKIVETITERGVTITMIRGGI